MRIASILITFLFLVSTTEASYAPPIDAVHQHVILDAGLAGNEIEKWKKRIPWGALTPQLRFSIQRDLNEQMRITNKDNISISSGEVTIGPNEQDILQDFDAGTKFQVTAVWNLDRLLFSRDSVLVSQERRRRNQERYDLLDKVNKHYFERLAAIEVLASNRRIPLKERLKLKTLIQDRTARLDAYTGGWFSEGT
jgi:hypothetical protein